MKFLPYTVYGAQAAQNFISSAGFNGEYYDYFSGCYPLGLGYRLYSPSLMRFLSPDTLSPFGKGGQHTYAYCQNDPVNHVDRSGHMRTPSPRSAKHSMIKRLSPPSWSASPRRASSSRSVSAKSLDTPHMLSGYTATEIDFSLDFLHNSPAKDVVGQPSNQQALGNPSSALSWPDFFGTKGMVDPRQIYEESKRLAASISLDPIVPEPVSFRTRLVIYMTTAGNSRSPTSALRSVYRNITDIEVGETAIYAENIRMYSGTHR